MSLGKDFDVQVINSSDYALMVLVRKDGTTDVRGTVPKDQIAAILRSLLDAWENRKENAR